MTVKHLIEIAKKPARRVKRLLKRLLKREYEFKRGYDSLRYIYVSLLLRLKYRLKITQELQTIQYLEKNACSMARLGNGELDFVLQRGATSSYQADDPALTEALKEVLFSADPELLICLPHGLLSTRGYHGYAKWFWRWWTGEAGLPLVRLLSERNGLQRRFGDTQVTRAYMDRKSYELAETIFSHFKKLWEGRDILMVEGTHTRFGVGNDLLSGARSVKRILCPAIGAFSVREEILATIVSVYSGELILLALGPTATVLAVELSSLGMRALDIGHLDIEYEWFLRRADDKFVVPGKYVNEVWNGQDVTSVCEDPDYLAQIVARAGLS